MPITSDANNWWEAPNSSMPQQGFGTASGVDTDWFHVGALSAWQPARVSVLPDYQIPYFNGILLLDTSGLAASPDCGESVLVIMRSSETREDQCQT